MLARLILIVFTDDWRLESIVKSLGIALSLLHSVLICFDPPLPLFFIHHFGKSLRILVFQSVQTGTLVPKTNYLLSLFGVI